MTTFSKPSNISLFSKELSNVDDIDLTLIIATLAAVQMELVHLDRRRDALLYLAKREEINRKHYIKRRERMQAERRLQLGIGDEEEECQSRKSKFPSWSELSDGVSDLIFRRKYRMTKKEFDLLCECIQNKVGVDVFRPNNGQGLCGKVRVAIGLRMLCGGSYLDLVGRAYGVESTKAVYNYFHTCVDWIDAAFDFELIGLLEGLKRGDEDAIRRLKEISSDFAVDSDHIFVGCIGAIDGIAIRIMSPDVDDPGNYFCRKNFYALNAQAICDRQKRILWISPGHLGSSHDSTAFAETCLHDLLEEMKDKLKEHGFFFVGDSAYPLSVYMQVPFSNARPHTPQDAYNFWLSNSRIHIECTFGEFIMRFGLFWRTLRFDTMMCTKIIRAASKLHNFLIDCREDTADDDAYFRNMTFASIPSIVSGQDDDDMTFPLVVDNNEPKPTGRKNKKRKRQESEGQRLRNDLCAALHEEDMLRPKRNRMRYNALGHVYFV